MTLNELRYIVTLARERHYGRAAEACYVSQPTLSVAVSKLQSKLGVTIFERCSNELCITEVGAEIIQQCERAIAEIEKINIISQLHHSQLETPLRVGAIYTVAPYLFPNLIPSLQRIAPNMPLYITEALTANLQKQLADGTLDVVFLSLPYDAPGIITRKIYEEPMRVLMHHKHKLAQRESISTSDLMENRVLLLGEGHCFRDNVLDACPECYNKEDGQQTVEGASLETLRHMVASGFGITLLPSTATHVSHYSNVLCTKPLQGKTPLRSVALAWRVNFPRTKAITALIDALRASQIEGICPVAA